MTYANEAQRLATAVARLNRRLRRERRSELTPNQTAVLGTLGRKGPLTAGALAEAERVQPPTMTRIVNGLVELGYVLREPHPTDRRQVVVTISDDGESWLAAERKRRDMWLSKRLRDLDPDDRAVLREAVGVLERLSTS